MHRIMDFVLVQAGTKPIMSARASFEICATTDLGICMNSGPEFSRHIVSVFLLPLRRVTRVAVVAFTVCVTGGSSRLSIP